MTHVPPPDPARSVRAYHERTKHHPHRYAAALGYMDWDTQPDPFRTYEGAPRVELPLGADDLPTPFGDLLRPGAAATQPLMRATAALLFELALGLSAWKESGGSRWALRCNPSSGNLHPTEGYLIAPALPGVAHPPSGALPLPGAALPAGVYHYVSRDHCLEHRCALDAAASARLAALLGPQTVLIGLSSIHWREAWKYGERAFRYCQHDVGHAAAAVAYAAAALGWRAALMDDADDATVAAALGLDREADFAAVDPRDREHPDLLLAVGPDAGAAGAALQRTGSPSASLGAGSRDGPLGALPEARAIAALVQGGAWSGRANPLSAAHHRWEAIDDVAAAAARPEASATEPSPPTPWVRAPLPKGEGGRPSPPAPRGALIPSPLEGGAGGLTGEGGGCGRGDRPVVPTSPAPLPAAATPAATLIRARRSAVAMDGVTEMARDAFFRTLDHLLPRPGLPPWGAIPWAPRVHLAIFVHRVRGLEPGLYLLIRRPEAQDALRAACRSDFAWARVPGAPETLPLYRLAAGDCRARAAAVSCQQDIAGDGAFSLGMIAEYRRALDEGPWWYRRLFWESGAVGQALYLLAEAEGLRGTGIGCYFDDEMHRVLGLAGDEFQSLYHFTVGGPVEDARLRTRPPYEHLVARAGQRRTRCKAKTRENNGEWYQSTI